MFELVMHPDFGELNDIEQIKPYFETYETPLRYKMIWRYLKKIGYITRDFSNTNLITNESKNLVIKKPKALKDKDILRVHTKYHLELVKKYSLFGTGQIGNLVMATEDTYDLALLSAGSVYEAIKDVYIGKCDQAFSINRPPGHHALPDASDGLCVFNNIPIAIEKLRNEDNFNGKIAIIDIDTHYGDGIAKIYYEDKNILYSSIHEYDFTTFEAGSIDEIGEGKGKGYNINFPIPLFSDDSFLVRYTEFLEPFLKKFKPEIIIIATGFDGHWADPLGNLNYTSKGYEIFAKWLKNLSAEINGGKICFCLEGGYNLLTLPKLVEVIISCFINQKILEPFDEYAYDCFTNEMSLDENLNNIIYSHYNEKIKYLEKKITKFWNQ